MNLRVFGKTGWKVSEVGYGMWGMGGWTGSNDEESLRSLYRAVELGCNFFDTAWAYGEGRSERLLGQLIRAFPQRKLYAATKIPPKNMKWPSKPEYSIKDTFPPEHIREYVEKSLRNLDVETIDLFQFHVWDDSWGADKRWQQTIDDLKRQKLIRAVGISINRWEPENVLETLRTGFVDAVQVIYNVFDQAPEDRLFPLCRELEVAVIARVPFDEGTLTGTLTSESTWPKGDWRNTYFVAENLKSSLEHARLVKEILPQEMTMPEAALRFILSNKDICTTIPGMRKLKNVEANFAASETGRLDEGVLQLLRGQRWDRKPTTWSQ